MQGYIFNFNIFFLCSGVQRAPFFKTLTGMRTGASESADHQGSLSFFNSSPGASRRLVLTGEWVSRLMRRRLASAILTGSWAVKPRETDPGEAAVGCGALNHA
jgi:hypothetical protein